VRHAIETTHPLIEQRKHELIAHQCDESLWSNADPTRLEEVIVNLLDNAAKYTPDGGRITVSATAEGSWAAIDVTDTGVGITSEMLQRVFDLFAQADTSLDRAEGGLGIGLTLVDKLVRMHGGVVEGRSAGRGLGSTFTIRLPLMRSRESQVDDRPARLTTFGRRVLVVDDNEDSAEMLKMLLEMNDHEVWLAHNGRDALTAASVFQPDAILLDIGLPGMDGYQVIAQLRAMRWVSPVIIVATTGYGRDEDRARCLAAGFDDHLTKPIDPAQLEDILKVKGRR